jgi:hypothetical protein
MAVGVQNMIDESIFFSVRCLKRGVVENAEVVVIAEISRT